MNKKSSRGFTIVELLVVIVVIGILAAITIVSYSGITAKANTATNQSNANSVLQAALAVYAETGSYPATDATSNNVITNLNAGSAKVPKTITVTNAVAASGSTIRYIVNAAGTGICVSYWNYQTPGVASLLGGVATADSNASTASSTCTP